MWQQPFVHSTPLELRDRIIWSCDHQNLMKFLWNPAKSIWNSFTVSMENHWDLGYFHQILMLSTSNGPISELKRSWIGKRLLSHSISNVCYTLSRFLERSETSRHDFWSRLVFFVFLQHPLGYNQCPNDLLWFYLWFRLLNQTDVLLFVI